MLVFLSPIPDAGSPSPSGTTISADIITPDLPWSTFMFLAQYWPDIPMLFESLFYYSTSIEKPTGEQWRTESKLAIANFFW